MLSFNEADYFRIRNKLLQEELAAILTSERKYMAELLDIVQSAAEDIYQDFEKALRLRPFWINYAPSQRGRAPKDESVPWADMGEKTIIARLARAVAEKYPNLTHPGLPVGGDFRLATSDALIHFDVKLTGPNDNAYEILVSPYQISGDGAQWVGGVINSVEVLKGRKDKTKTKPFYPQLPPFYVLDGNVLLCLTYFLKVVYVVLEKGNQPLDYLELVSVPNGLLLFDGPTYSDTVADLLAFGKDEQAYPDNRKRARIELDPLASVADWRCTKIIRTEEGWITRPRKVSSSQAG